MLQLCPDVCHICDGHYWSGAQFDSFLVSSIATATLHFPCILLFRILHRVFSMVTPKLFSIECLHSRSAIISPSNDHNRVSELSIIALIQTPARSCTLVTYTIPTPPTNNSSGSCLNETSDPFFHPFGVAYQSRKRKVFC